MSVSDSAFAKQDHDLLWSWGRNNDLVLGRPMNAYIYSPTKIDMLDVIMLACKTSNVVVLSGVGAAWCWGENGSGQLGDNSTTDSRYSIAVVGGHSFTKVQAGHSFTVGLKSDGSVWSWGENGNGQLGDDTTVDKSSPIKVVGNHSFDNVISGWSHTLALKASGEVWAWGHNFYGQLGDDTNSYRSSPVLVVGNHTFVGIAAGARHSLARKASGEVWTCGENGSGQLGSDDTTGRSSPVLVVGNHNFVEISAGEYHSTARKSADGSVWSWGDGEYGQLGQTFGLISKSSPVLVVGSHSFAQVVSGCWNTYGRKANGEVWSWGDANWGQLGLGKKTFGKASPVQMFGGGYTSFSACIGFTAFAKQDRGWFSWGLNTLSQATLPYDTLNTSRPNALYGSEYFIQWSIGQSHGLAINEIGKVYNWGATPGRALDTGTTYDNSSPVLVVSNHTFTKIHRHCDQFNSQWLGLKADGSVWSWGDTSNLQGWGELTTMHSPVPVLGNHSFIDVVSGDQHALALKANGEVWAWGRNVEGQLGNNSFIGTESPVKVVGNHTFTAIGAGYRHSMALKGADGSCWTWGENDYGKLGINVPASIQSSPRLVVGNHSFIQVSGGSDFGGAVKANGEIWMWGLNNYGQVGDNTSTNKSSPVKVWSGLYDSLSCGYDHSVAISTGDAAYAWGYNDYGQIGQGEATFIHSRPMLVNGGHDFSQIWAGYKMTTGLGLNAEVGEIWSWGVNASGQLANGVIDASSNTPVQAVGNHSFSSIYLIGGMKASDEIWGWGEVATGLFQLNSGQPQPAFLSEDSYKQVVAGESHSFMRKENGEVWAWGTNTYGQVGDNTLTVKTSPVLVVGSHSFNHISAGRVHSMAVKGGDGKAWAWGNSFYGQLGDGTRDSHSSPVQVVCNHSFTYTSLGGYHSLALKANGEVWAWGRNIYGQLGDSTSASKSSPILVVGNHSFVDIDAGDLHSMAIKANGEVWCWGYNSGGRLGDGTMSNRNSPRLVIGNHSFSEIGTVQTASLAKKENGEVWTWGNNLYGELGDGTTTNRSSPVLVIGSHYFDSIKVARIVMGFPISWGHFFGISEEYSRSFRVTWTPGTVILGEGDAEALGVHAGTNEISSVIHTGAIKIECVQNKYGSGDTFTDVKYRHGTTQAECEVASWNDYTGSFTSLGYVQFKLTRAAA